MTQSTPFHEPSATLPTEADQLWEVNAGWWQECFTEGADPEYREQIVPLLRDLLAEAAPATVLDIGCGEGQLSRVSARLPGVRLVVGVDPTRAQLEAGAPAPAGARCAEPACRRSRRPGGRDGPGSNRREHGSTGPQPTGPQPTGPQPTGPQPTRPPPTRRAAVAGGTARLNPGRLNPRSVFAFRHGSPWTRRPLPCRAAWRPAPAADTASRHNIRLGSRGTESTRQY